MKHATIALASFTIACLLSGCAPIANPYPPVPPLMVETIPKPPVTPTPLVWQPGHWDWTGNSYLWQPGQYVPSTGHSNLWVPGFWAPINGGWVWQSAHWQ